MDENISLDHHAYLLAGDPESIVPGILLHLHRAHGISMTGNPNMLVLRLPILTIDHARDLRDHARMSGFGGEKKIIVLAFDSITLEAQNALLKAIEEPRAGTHFFFVTPAPAALLPTVRSRLLFVHQGNLAEREGVGGQEAYDGNEFLKASLGERMAMIEPFYKDKDLKEDGDNKSMARAFLDAIEVSLAQRDVSDKKIADALGDIFTAKRYLTRGAAMKILMEHLALTLPQLSVNDAGPVRLF